MIGEGLGCRVRQGRSHLGNGSPFYLVYDSGVLFGLIEFGGFWCIACVS